MAKMHHVIANVTRGYSPIMLNHDWPKLGRLLFTLLCSIIGITMNGFFVASFFVEPGLNKIGYVFMACVGLSDMIVSMAVLPTSAVVLLSGEWDIEPVCRALQILTEGATYSYSLFFTLSAIESYYRLCKATSDYDNFVSMRIGLLAMVVFVISFSTATAGVYINLDYDYCRRHLQGSYCFRLATLVIFYGIPFVITLFCLLSNACRIKEKARKHNHYKRSQQYEQDSTTNNLNIAAYVLFSIAWVPYLIVVYVYEETTDSSYYQSVWLGVCRSVVTSFLYGSMDRRFRRAFAHLFNYCCCKSTLSGSFASRHRRALEYKCATGDVRVHIMHQAVNVNSPQRGASSSRETQEL